MQVFKKDILVSTSGKSDYVATLQAYIPDNTPEVDTNRVRPAVLILPGGGYFYTSDRENEPIALKFVSEGICAFVLKYSCAPARFPQAVCEALTAVKYIRENAEKFYIDTENISVCGFSAGGHLAASVGVFWNKPFIAEYIGENGNSMKPNKLILSYPVIKNGEFAHQGSFDYLLGEDNQTEELLELTSLEKQITADTPPSLYGIHMKIRLFLYRMLWYLPTDLFQTIYLLNCIFIEEALTDFHLVITWFIQTEYTGKNMILPIG